MNDNTDYLANLIAAFSTTVSTNIEQDIAELGARNLSHEAALVAIRNHPDDSIDILSRILKLTHSGTVRLINTLVKEELVERHKSSTDARTVLLRVTEKGKIRVEKVLKTRTHASEQVITALNKNQQQDLTSILETALTHLTKSQEEARRICRLCNEQVCRSQGCPVEMSIPESI